ncbi:hypothetical protein JOM56_012960 [Amanita muscaria]
MPGPLSNDLKERMVKWYLEDGYTMADIAQHARCSISTVSIVLRNYREFGRVDNPFKRITGRPRCFEEADIEFLKAILTAHPSLYLDEIQGKLASVRG